MCLLLIGVERVAIDPGNTAFTPLDDESSPWSHSLLMVTVWSVLLGAGRASGSATCVEPSGPSGPVTGLGLWNSVAGTLVVEGTMCALGIVLYTSLTRATSRTGTWAFVGLAMWLFPAWAARIEGRVMRTAVESCLTHGASIPVCNVRCVRGRRRWLRWGSDAGSHDALSSPGSATSSAAVPEPVVVFRPCG